ncbi:MAG: HEAT repeat domain-containing protein [Deltaproteobacteria bacterium]|nr:HEAT repeat domain-containing protein [Deltaproteobacteria bacterium]
MTDMVYLPAFATASDPFIKMALAGGMIIMLLSLLFSFQVLLISGLRSLGEKRKAKLARQWRPIFSEIMEKAPENLPVLGSANVTDFLILWNHYHGFLKGNARENLNLLLRRLRLDKDAIKMLRGRSLKRKFVGIMTLGNLRDSYVWNDLCRMLSHKNNHLSLAAAEAMVQIRPREAVQAISDSIRLRNDWPDSRIVCILKKTDANYFSSSLADAVFKADDKSRPRLIKLSSIALNETIRGIVKKYLNPSAPEEVIAACLHILKHPEVIEDVRRFTAHPSPLIRLKAAAVLGRIGEKEDMDVLTSLLSDKQWWVRYHAARSLVSFPFVTQAELKAISNQCKDRYGRDMLNRMIAKAEIS